MTAVWKQNTARSCARIWHEHQKSAHSRKCLRRCPIWLDNLISGFGDHILKFETDAAIVWGALLSHEKKDPHPIDKQIAAIALIYNLVLVTRDKGYAFAKIPNLRVINPFN